MSDESYEGTMRVTVIGSETLREIEARIFVERTIGVEDAAAEYSLEALQATIRNARASMHVAAAVLPDCAFDPQPSGAEGEAVWSAGEIAGHIAESMLWLEFALARLAGLAPSAPDDVPGITVRDRAATVATLNFADRALDRCLDAAADLSDEPRSRIDGLGDVGVRGLLLLHAMHEVEHAAQLRALGDGKYPALLP